ncbi:MAG: formylmethanofuran--tetrahydromethanopterin N-formyltransferase, partial [Chloroflexi bacterium]|nr:formylmethanofuran--tetrahydromethanopterin N-formyltransferase [Chloroflexota bacterium]
RPGVSILIFAMSKKSLEDQLLRRIGQCILTCPTTACFNGLESEESIPIGKSIRFFGDGFQMSKFLDGRRYWRIPVMEGEFLIEESYGFKKAIGGGNILILGDSVVSALTAAEKAVEASKRVKDVILPFPGGIVRSGSKVGSKYKFLKASTNTDFIPHLRAHTSERLPIGVRSVFEIVFDGLTLD